MPAPFRPTSIASNNFLQSSTAFSVLYGSATKYNAFIANAGKITMVGGPLDDTYVVNDPSDIVVEAANGGIDTVKTAGGGFTLPANVENLTLTGSVSAKATGNAGNNLIIGNAGNDTITTGGGNDVLVAGTGSDYFIPTKQPGSTTWITHFKTSGSVLDKIDLYGFGFVGFDQVKAAMTQVGSDVKIDLGSGQSVMIEGKTVADITPSVIDVENDPAAGMHLTFDDEFNTLSLNTGTAATAGGTWKTTFATPWGNVRTLTGNSELELYVDPDYKGTAGAPLGLNPFSINNGVLSISARPASASTLPYLGGYQYTSGLLTTEKSFSQTYGYFEMRAEVPDGKGLWPAFWLLSPDGKWPPELDVMEQIGSVHNWISNGILGATTTYQHGTSVPNNNSLAFHTYGMSWTPQTIIFYYDGQPIAQAPTPADMTKPMYLLLNLAVGGTLPGSPDSTTNWSTADYKIDYVRVYSYDPTSVAPPALTFSQAADPSDLSSVFNAVPTGPGTSTTYTAQQLGIVGIDPNATVTVAYDANNALTVTENGAWGGVNNAIIKSGSNGYVTVNNFVDAEITLANGDSQVSVTGAMRGSITVGNGNDTIAVTALSNDTANNLMRITAGDGVDHISFSGAANTAAAILAGNGGNTVVIAGQAQATVTTGTGNDHLVDSSTGPVTLAGGAGGDLFEFSVGANATISDFQAGLDSIVLHGLSPSQVQVTAAAGSTLISLAGGGSILLAGVSLQASQLNLAYVDYAGAPSPATAVTALSMTPGTGALNAGKVVILTVNLSAAVTVDTANGLPTLALLGGGVASYTGGSGTNALTFSYTVAAGQNIPDLMVTAFNLNGATVRDGTGVDADLTGAVKNPAGILQIDTTAPTVTSIATAGAGITNGAGDLSAGKVVTLTVTLSEAVTVDASGGVPTLALNDGGAATYTGGSGTKTLTFSYTVAAGHNTADLTIASLTLNGATIRDGATNNADPSGATNANPVGILQIDTTAPAAVGVALVSDTGANGGDHITRNGALTLGGVESGSLVEYSTNGGTTWSTSFNAVEGANTVLVRQSDMAGNVSGPTSFGFTLDTTRPAVPAVALASDTGANGSDHVTSNGALTLGGVEGGALVEYSTDGGTNWSSTFNTVEGANTVQVRQTDAAGNVSDPTSFSFTLDTTRPAAPDVALASDTGANHITSNGALALGGVEGGALVEYSTDGGTNWSTSFIAVEGANTVLVRQTDAAGNVSDPTSFGFTLDTTAPTVSSVVASPGTGDLNAGHIVTLTLNLSEAVIVASGTPTLTLSNGGTATYDPAHSTATALVFTYTVAAGEDTADLAVTAVNLNGGTINNGAANGADLSGAVTNPAGVLQIDTTAPAAVGITLASDTGSNGSDHITSDGALALGGVEAGTLVEYSSDGGTNWNASFSAVEGANTVLVRQTDAAGNISDPVSFSFTLDTTNPAVPAVALASDTGRDGSDHITSNGALALGGVEASALVEYSTDGGTSWSTSFSAGEGVNTVLVRQTDVAGNVSDPVSFSFTLDTMGPAVPAVALASDTGANGSDHVTRNGALTLGGVEGGALVEYSTDGGANWSTSFSAVEGVNAVLVRQTDVAGNVSSPTSFSFTLDTTRPAVPAVTLASDTGANGADHVTSNGALALGGVEAGALVEYSTDGGTSWSPSFSAVEGANTVLVRQTDMAGNVSDPASFNLTLDTTAPAVSSVVASPGTGKLGVGGIVTLTVNLSEAVTVAGGTPTLTLNDGGVATYTGGSGTSALTFSYTVAAGQNTPDLAVTAANLNGAALRDAAGNDATLAGAATNPAGILQIDTAATNAPSIGQVTDNVAPTTGPVAAGGSTNDTTPTVRVSLTGTGAVAGNSVQLFNGASALGSPVTLLAADITAGFKDITPAALSQGSYSFNAKVINAAGNASAASTSYAVTIDTAAPSPPTFTGITNDSGPSSTDRITNDNTLVINGTAEIGSKVQVFRNTTLIGTATTDGTGHWTLDSTATILADGSYQFNAKAIDAAGNVGQLSAAYVVTIDTKAPATTITGFSPDTGKAGDGLTSGNASHAITLSGTAEANSIVKVFDGTTLLGTATASGSGTWSFLTAALNDGTHAFTASATDKAGNAGAISSALQVVVDRTAPTTAITDLVANADHSVTLSGTTEANSSVAIYDGSPIKATVTADANGIWSYKTAANLSNTLHSFAAQGTDGAGNIGLKSALAIYGTTGNDKLTGGSGADLIAGQNGNDTLTGGAGSDTFVFAPNFGKDVITDFVATGAGHDIIQLDHTIFADFATTLAHAAQVGADLVITQDAADVITLKNVTKASLTASDFHFV